MIIKVIFAQRIQNYDGEYAPETLEVVTEFGYNENPSWIEDKLIEYRNRKEYVSVRIIDINIDMFEIQELLNVTPKVLGLVKGY